MGSPVMIGVSRKSFIGEATGTRVSKNDWRVPWRVPRWRSVKA